MKIQIKTEKGIALIIVMLVIFVLAVLVGTFAYSMKVETTLARNANYETELEWLGRSGVDLARYMISQKCPGQESFEALNQQWAGGFGGCSNDSTGITLQNVQMGAGTFSVKITDLERKFNINMADQSVLQQALTVMGVDASLTPSISDAVLDWVDKDEDNHLSGAESDYYLSLAPPYVAKNGPLDDISELLLIKGIFENSEIYWGSASTNHSVSPFQARSSGRPFQDLQRPSYPVGLVDIFSTLSSGKININTASATTLQMIPQVDENIAAGIIQLRAGPDGTDGTEDDLPFHNYGELRNVPGMDNPQVVSQLGRYCDVRSHTFEVEVDVDLNGVKRIYYAVMRRGNKPGDFSVLKFYWK